MASTKNKPGFIKQRVYDEPVGPEYPKASTDGPNQPRPVYERPIGPTPSNSADRPFTDWNAAGGPRNSRGESMATGKHPAGPAPEYNKPIGPNQPQPYDKPIGPQPQSGREGFLEKIKGISGKTQPWDAPEKGLAGMKSNRAGTKLTNTDPLYTRSPGQSAIPESGGAAAEAAAPAEASAKGFFTELGQLMKKWGAPPEALGKIAPVASQLFRFVGAAGLATGVVAEAKRDLPGVVSALTPRSFDDVPDTPGGSPIEKWYSQGADNPMKFLSGDSTQSAAAEPTQQPSGSTPADVAQQSQAQPSEAPTAAESHARETDTGRDATVAGKDAKPLPKEDDVPEFLFQPGTKGKEIPVAPDKPAAKAAPITNPSKGKAAPKQEKPLSDEDIVAWNAQHNKSFAPQDGGSVPFQPAQGTKQSDGVLFVGGNVYMQDPRDPSGYKLIHSYGQGNGQ